MVSAIEKRLEAIEEQLAAYRHPKLVFCWTRQLAERIQAALGPAYTTVNIRGMTGCAGDDEFEALIRQDPIEAERLDRLLAGIPPE